MKEDQERPPLRTILQNFLNHIENLESQSDSKDSYESEFQELKLFSESLKHEEEYSCSEGEKNVNRKKNRYKDILPFNISRVILAEYAGVPGSDYINANYIKGASGSMAYIASQGPLPNTVNDFWRMVVQCEVQVIVMACNEEESGKHKCENYWVESDSEEKKYGIVTIKLLKASTICPDFSVRTMKLTYTNPQSQQEERTVCQFHYCAWPDHGVPPLVKPLLDMVRLVRDTQASETLPVLIHCSAGCGRTGTICAIDYVWGLLRAGKLTKDFSLFSLVRNMRKQRIAMVQTKEQYVLVHQAVRELFREQLKMIDSHPYENIDCNGMPLLKEVDPIYDTVGASQQTSVEINEKQDEKEKNSAESFIQAPPLPSKKKTIYVASKEEKEVENLSEKQRLVEQGDSSCESVDSSGGNHTSSHKMKIAKLKSLFERSGRESRRHAKHAAISRSQSVGAVCKLSPEEMAKPPALENKHQKKPARLSLNQGKSQGSPQNTPQTTPKNIQQNICQYNQNSPIHNASQPPLPNSPQTKVTKSSKSGKSKIVAQIKRSKSMKVIGSEDRTVLTSTPFEQSNSKQFVCDIVPGRRSMPAHSENNSLRERRLSLESIVDEIKQSTKTSSHNEQTHRIDSLLDEQTRKFLQDCRQYLFGAKGSKNDKRGVVTRVKERRNSFCQAVSKSVNENTNEKEYETVPLDAPKKPALVRSYTALDMRAASRTPIKYTPVNPEFSTPKPTSSHKHSHHHSSSSSKQFSASEKSNSTTTEALAPANIPLYQNVQFLGLKNAPSHSSQVFNPQSHAVYSSTCNKPKPQNSSELPQLALARKNVTEISPSSSAQESSPGSAAHQQRLKSSQEKISEQQDASKKQLHKKQRSIRQTYVSNTFPLQASKSASSGYSSSSSMERTVRQPRVGADFRKSDPIIQNYCGPNFSKPLSQGNTPSKDVDSSAKPYLIPSIGPRLKTSPNMVPNPTILKNRPPFPPSYQTACASSAVNSTNFLELANYDVIRGNRPNPMKANIGVLPSPHYHSSNKSPSSSKIQNPVRAPNVSDSRALPPDHRYSDVPTCSQLMNHSSQNLSVLDPQTPYSAPSNWPQSGHLLNMIPASEDATPKTSRIKPSLPSTSLKNNADLASVRMRHGSRDDLALCGAGSNPPNRVKRHASVVLSRGNLIETNDHTLSLANWNSSQVNGSTRSPPVNYHHHHPAPQQPKSKEYENWSEAPGIDLDKVAATLSEKESDSSQFMRKTLEGLHIRKRIPSNSPGSHEASSSSLKPLGAQQQSNPPISFKKQQQYL